MPKRTGAALLAAMIVLFLIANRAAYKGYFQGDDLDNLSWTRNISIHDFATGLASPVFFTNNFRPAGHFYYYALGRAVGLHFPWYVAVIQLLHVLNVWLLWLLIRRLGFSPFAAAAGTLLFAFHMAVFDAYWKPMYVFDVLCGSFCLLSLLFYVRGRWIISFVFFWLAYKSKEIAVMLPLALAAWELWLGDRRWKRLLPFLLVSISFGLQGVIRTPHFGANDEYTFRFTPAAIGKTLLFYASKVFLVPYAGLALLGLPFILRDRRLYFGLVIAGAFLTPMLFLPGRLYGAYLYVPLLGVAVIFAAVAARRHWAPIVLFFALWLPANYLLLRENRRVTLARADENRSYVTALAKFARSNPAIRGAVYDGWPPAMHPWGVEGTLRYLYGRGDLAIQPIDGSDVLRVLRLEPLALLSWEPAERRLYISLHTAGAPEASYITMSRETPIWQMQEGWYWLENRYRWTAPRAAARLYRPADAAQFELVVNIGPGQIQDVGKTAVQISLNGRVLGRAEFKKSGWQTVRWDLPVGPPGTVDVEFRIDPEYHPSNDSRTLGIPVAAFGFVRPSKQ